MYMIIYTLWNLDTKIQRETDARPHAHTVIGIEMNQLAGDRHQRDRERWSEKDGVSEVKEYIKALSVQAAV